MNVLNNFTNFNSEFWDISNSFNYRNLDPVLFINIWKNKIKQINEDLIKKELENIE